MSRVVTVCAPARLHFGLFSFGRTDVPQFGGVGLMVAPPGLRVCIAPSDTFSIRGPLALRADRCARRFFAQRKLENAPCCEIAVQAALPEHIGLGAGTQLSLAIVAGLARFLGATDISAEQLARWSGRGGRSAVGTHGFVHGGLVVDGGKQSNDALGALAARVSLPSAWRVVLIRIASPPGKFGQEERLAFERLPPIPHTTRAELLRLAHEIMLPAIAGNDCIEFGEAVYRFGVLAGECFSQLQGGAFAGPKIAELVNMIRRFGVRGAGQSSWGPTVFAITCDQRQAEALCRHLRSSGLASGAALDISKPNNTGAIIETRSYPHREVSSSW